MTIETEQSQPALFLFPRDEILEGRLTWMGNYYPAALADVLVKGFQRQQPGTRLVSVKALKQPELVTSFFTGTLNKRIRVNFLVEALLVDPKGKPWQLEVKATCTGRMLARPEDGILSSDVDVIKVTPLNPGGDHLLTNLAQGITLERRRMALAWGMPLAEVLDQSKPTIEVIDGTQQLSWANESILDGLKGQLMSSFAPDLAGLESVSIWPDNERLSDQVEDSLLPEWEHLTNLFGPPDEQKPGCSYHWLRSPLEFILEHQACHGPHNNKKFQKSVTVRKIKEN